MTALKASPGNGRYPRDPVGKRWRGRLPIPAHVHPLVRRFIGHLNDQFTAICECADRAGLSRAGMGSWFCRRTPRLDNFEAALNALDLELRIVPRRDAAIDLDPLRIAYRVIADPRGFGFLTPDESKALAAALIALTPQATEGERV